jgi:bacillolysin
VKTFLMSASRRCVATFLCALAVSARPAQGAEALRPAAAGLVAAAGQRARVAPSSIHSGLSFFGAERGKPLALPGLAEAKTPTARVAAFVHAYGAAFAVKSAAEVRIEGKPAIDALGMEHIRLRQLKQGVPVTGGELTLHLVGGALAAVHAKTLDDDIADVAPRLSAVEARVEVEALMRRTFDAPHATIGDATLEVFNRGLLDGQAAPTRLAWFFVAIVGDRRESVWVDASTGGVLLHFDSNGHARVRRVHDAGWLRSLPGALRREEGQPATGDPDVDGAYDALGDAYDFFLRTFGRDGFDGAGAPLVASVNWGGDEWPFWNGKQVAAPYGFVADDVIAHEVTHGVVESTARLFPYGQPGALNEGLADIFGETVDLLNGRGNDTADARWRIGEDSAYSAFRNMRDPLRHGQPERMGGEGFSCGDIDQGGIHINSSLPNRAYALMVDDGKLGTKKAAAIHYRALTLYLASGSSFHDYDLALRQSCSDLIGTDGMTVEDCVQVGAALDTVGMAEPWACEPRLPQVPPTCPAGQPVTAFREGFESDLVRWRVSPSDAWARDRFFAAAGKWHVFAPDPPRVVDAVLEMTEDVTVPAGDPRLEFRHAWTFDAVRTAPMDGGVVEYSLDGGLSWLDAASFLAGGAPYTGLLFGDTGNPLAGRDAFAHESHGYTTTQYALAPLAGRKVRFRWRLGSDVEVGALGWMVDDVHLYSCDAQPGALSVLDVRAKEPSREAIFDVTLSRAASSPVTVSYRTVEGTATAGVDYLPMTGRITFAPGQTSRPVVVRLLDDSGLEGDETFTLELFDPKGAPVGRARARATIVDDEQPPLTLSIADATVSEGAGEVSLTVSLSRAAEAPVTVAYHTADVTARVGRDYIAASGILRFAPGQTTQTVRVSVRQDDELEAFVETFRVVLENPVGATILRGMGEVGLFDDEVRPARVRLLMDTAPGPDGILGSFERFGDKTLFFGPRLQPWITDGTEAGTHLVREITPPRLDTNFGLPMLTIGATALFGGTDGHGTELWRTDGTKTGTALVKDIWPGSPSGALSRQRATVNGLGFFVAYEPERQFELWRSDGTPDGTFALTDTVHTNPSALSMTVLDEHVLFTRPLGALNAGLELWITDGTVAGTRLLRSFEGDGAPHDESRPFRAGSHVFFPAPDASGGWELWKTDGTTEGTTRVADVRPGPASSNLWYLQPLGDRIVFMADDGVHGLEPWITDGTEAGTRLLKDIVPGADSSDPRRSIQAGPYVYFTADDLVHGRELWRTDGSEGGTLLVADIAPGRIPSLQEADLMAAGVAGELVFTANDRVHGLEPWKTDGTRLGTRLLADLNPGARSSSPIWYHVSGAQLFFVAYRAEIGGEPYVYDLPALSVTGDVGGEGQPPRSVPFEVAVTNAADAAITVQYETVDGTATAGSDYVRTRGTLTFPVGTTRQTVLVPVVDDGVAEAKETVTLRLTSARGAVIKTAEAAGVIQDDDAGGVAF